MWTMILSFLGGPLINGLLGAYQKRLDAQTAEGAQAAGLVTEALKAEIEARKQATAVILAEQGTWFTRAPRALVQWSFALFVAKVVVYDNLLGLGSTDPLSGDVSQWAGMLMGMWFGGRTIEKVAAMFKAR